MYGSVRDVARCVIASERCIKYYCHVYYKITLFFFLKILKICHKYKRLKMNRRYYEIFNFFL